MKGENCEMKLDPRIMEDVKSHSRGIISFIDEGGCLHSIISRYDLKRHENHIEILTPKSLRQKLAPKQKACIIIHYNNNNNGEINVRQLVVSGVINEQDSKLIFLPQQSSISGNVTVEKRKKFILNVEAQAN